MEDMPRKLPLHVVKETSRHGKIVLYFRIGKGERTRLPALSDPKFKAAYKAALSGMPDEEPDISPARSIRWLVERHMQSGRWAGLSAATRKQQGLFFKGLIEISGNENFTKVTAKDIRNALDERKHTPFLANNYLKALNSLFSWAVENVEGVTLNPCLGVKRLRTKSNGFPVWTDEDLEKFRVKWPIGTIPRLAMEMLLLSGLRRSDICQAGRQHMRGNVFSLTTEKTNTEITVEFPQSLIDIINKTETGDLCFIANANGLPFTKESFGNWFGDRCREAGLVRKNAHGLRKLAATLAANAGATSNGLMAQFGWSNTRQADVYTKSADRVRLGVATSRLVAEQIGANQIPHLNAGAGKTPKTEAKTKVKKVDGGR